VSELLVSVLVVLHFDGSSAELLGSHGSRESVEVVGGGDPAEGALDVLLAAHADKAITATTAASAIRSLIGRILALTSAPGQIIDAGDPNSAERSGRMPRGACIAAAPGRLGPAAAIAMRENGAAISSSDQVVQLG
jgi:hypothetical protein